MTQISVLVADEDPATAEFLTSNLLADGLQADCVHTPEQALDFLATRPVDVMVCDVNGQTKWLIEQTPPNVMILALGHMNDLDVVRRLDAGADDCVRKPLVYPEMLARINALVRRRDKPGAPELYAVPGGLRIDVGARVAYVGDEALDLTRLEFELLRVLIADPSRVFSKKELLERLWGDRLSVGSTRTLDSHACRLRRKLHAASGRSYIVNVWGVGYRLAES